MPLTTANVWLVDCWLVDLLTLPSFLWTLLSAKSKSTPVSQLVWLMVSTKSELLVKPHSAGLQLSSDTHFKVSESSDSMKCSKTFIKELSDNKTLKSTKKSDGQLHQVQLKSLLMFCFAHGKPSNLKFNFQDKVTNTQPNWTKPSLKSELRKEFQECTRVLFHSGQDKFHTPSSSSSLSNGSSNSSMTTSSLKEKKTTTKLLNSESLSLQVIWLVSSALLFLTQLILLLVSFILKVNLKDQLVQRLPRFTRKSDSVDFGLVFSPESLWSVPWLVFNGGFTTHSKQPSDYKPPVEDQKNTDLFFKSILF